MPKLVRDRIPEIARAKGDVIRVREAEDQSELFNLLRAKILEEAQELVGAKNRADVTEEFADVIEAVEALKGFFDPEHLREVRALKAISKGTFSKGIVLEDPGED